MIISSERIKPQIGMVVKFCKDISGAPPFLPTIPWTIGLI